MALALDAFFSPPNTVSHWLLGIVQYTKQPLPATHPNQLPQGSGAVQLWERRECMHAYYYANTKGNNRKPLPSKDKLSSSCPPHTIASDTGATHLSTKVYPEGARKERPWFLL